MSRDGKVDRLRQSPVCAGWPQWAVAELAREADVVTVEAGDVLAAPADRVRPLLIALAPATLLVVGPRQCDALARRGIDLER